MSSIFRVGGLVASVILIVLGVGVIVAGAVGGNAVKKELEQEQPRAGS